MTLVKADPYKSEKFEQRHRSTNVLTMKVCFLLKYCLRTNLAQGIRRVSRVHWCTANVLQYSTFAGLQSFEWLAPATLYATHSIWRGWSLSSVFLQHETFFAWCSEVSNCNMVAFTSKKQIRNDVERNRKAKRAIIPAMILKKMVKFAIFSKR